MSITGPGSINAANLAAQTNIFNQLNKLSLQLGTGEVSQTYAGLGPQAGVALSLSSQLAALNGYSTTATLLSVNAFCLLLTLDRGAGVGELRQHRLCQRQRRATVEQRADVDTAIGRRLSRSDTFAAQHSGRRHLHVLG